MSFICLSGLVQSMKEAFISKERPRGYEQGDIMCILYTFQFIGILFMSVSRMERKINRWIGAVSVVMRILYRSGFEEQLRWYVLSLHLWSQTVGRDQTHRIADTHWQNVFLREEPLLLHIRGVGLGIWFGCLLDASLVSHQQVAPGTNRDTLARENVFWLVCERNGIPQEELDKWMEGGKSGLPCVNYWPCYKPGISGRKWMVGWIKKKKKILFIIIHLSMFFWSFSMLFC